MTELKPEDFKNKHKGERCFIVATGPSINKINFDLIKGETIIGCNTLFRGFDKFGINCTYYCIGDHHFWDLIYDELFPDEESKLNPDTILFLQEDCLKAIYPPREVHIIPTSKPTEIRTTKNLEFFGNITEKHFGYGTVILNICLPVAYYLGFSEVYLLGVDCDMEYTGHFDGQYHIEQKFQKNHQLYIDEIESVNGRATEFAGYKACEKVFKKENRRLINCSIGGKLEELERMTLEEVVANDKMDSRKDRKLSKG